MEYDKRRQFYRATLWSQIYAVGIEARPQHVSLMSDTLSRRDVLVVAVDASLCFRYRYHEQVTALWRGARWITVRGTLPAMTSLFQHHLHSERTTATNLIINLIHRKFRQQSFNKKA